MLLASGSSIKDTDCMSEEVAGVSVGCGGLSSGVGSAWLLATGLVCNDAACSSGVSNIKSGS